MSPRRQPVAPGTTAAQDASSVPSERIRRWDRGRDSLSERILDATADLLARHGRRRTSMEDVARAAGCARQTLYRHYPSRDTLLQAVLLREIARYLDALDEVQSDEPTTPEEVEERFVFTVRYIREHPIARGLRETEPEAIVPLLLGAGDDVLGSITDAMAQTAKQRMEAGALRTTDPRLVAEAFIRFVISFVLVPKVLLDPDDEEAMRRLFRETFLEGLRPR